MNIFEIEKEFKNFKEELNKLETKIIHEFQVLNNQLNVGVIQKFKPLLLESVNIYLYKNVINKQEIAIKVNDETKQKLNLSNNVIFFRVDPDTNTLNNILQLLDKIAEIDKVTHEENIKILENNKQILEVIINFVEKTGIKSQYYGEIKVGRKRKYDWIMHEWVKDIKRQIPLNYYQDYLNSLLRQHKETARRLYEEELRKIIEQREREKRKQEQKEATIKLAKLLLKYNLPDTATSKDLLQHIIKQNKYLYLAHYLYMNRCDWTDGCSYAEEGLEFFKQHMDMNNPIDVEIYNEISHYIDIWEDCRDGRIFRDCEWNYNELYRVAREQDYDLYNDYMLVTNIINTLNNSVEIF